MRSAARPAIICCWSTAGRWKHRNHWTPPTTPSTSCFAPTPSTASSSSRRCCRPTAGPSGVARLVERFAHATMCSIGIELPGVPSLVLDNRPGMEAVVEHLVRDHGCRKIAFLAGTPENPEARVRFDAYQAVLARHGIAFDPALIARGYFRTNSAKVAMEEILARGVEIDGVVAANDEMATGAIDVLRKHGLRVPQDIPVTGFDDLMLARLGNPPLTTVAQPFDQVADWAVRAIEEQKAGRAGACVHRGRGAVRPPSILRVRLRSVPAGFAGRRPRIIPPTRAPWSIASSTLWPVLAGLLGTGFSSGAAAATRLLDGLRAETGRSARGVPRGHRRPARQCRHGQRAAADASQRDLLSPRRAAGVVEPAGRACPLRWTEPGRALQHDQPDAAPPAARRELPASARRGRASVDRLRPGIAAGRAGQGSAQRRRPHRVSGVRGGRGPGICCDPRCACGTASCWRAKTWSTPPASCSRPAR